jgi:glycosyltransferase involved in cell wall biosynthesis
VLVVIAAWNEQDCVGSVVTEVRELAVDVDVLVVDDGSTDAIAAVTAQAGAIAARLPENPGVGEAMRLGYRHGLGSGNDVAAQLDADGQHNPRYRDRLIAAMHHADLVVVVA